MSEAPALRWIQKTAMDLRFSVRQVAEGVVSHAPMSRNDNDVWQDLSVAGTDGAFRARLHPHVEPPYVGWPQLTRRRN